MTTGGEAGIRTLGGVTPTTVFETVPFGRSGTSPLVHIDTNSPAIFQYGKGRLYHHFLKKVTSAGRIAGVNGTNLIVAAKQIQRNAD